jgi:protein-disulfide isomerase
MNKQETSQHGSHQAKISPKLTFALGIISAIAIVSLVGFIVLLAKQGGDKPKTAVSDNAEQAANQKNDAPTATDITLAPVNSDDHIRGSLNATVKIVEYSDLECPFCKKHHSTMGQLVSEYSNDQVAWVFRHFPLDSLHPKSRKEAEATECAAELGGNDGFWALTDKIFEVTPGNNGLDLDTVPDLAVKVGLDGDKFTQCWNSGKYANKVQAQYQDATKAGGRGTPYNVIIGPDGQKVPLAGAYPIEAFKQIIDSMLNNSISAMDPSEIGAPIITISPNNYNFGKISQKKGVTATTFEITNNGKGDLIINKLKTSCNCTSASIIYQGEEGPQFSMPGHGVNERIGNWQVSISPNDTAQLKVYYDPNVHKNFRGPAVREIYIFSNDPVNPETKVRVDLEQID